MDNFTEQDRQQHKTPVKTRPISQNICEIRLISSPQKLKDYSIVDDIFDDSCHPNFIFFPSIKQPDSYNNFQSMQYQDINSEELSPEQQSIEEEKYQTVKKMPHQNLTENQGKYLTSARTNLKGCNCDKSKCLKNYCVCHKMGNTCSQDCECIDCENTSITSQHLKNQKVALQLLSNSKHKGCNCKNSNCVKKYCLCHQYGRKCSEMCKCENCHNMDPQAKDRDDMYGHGIKSLLTVRKKIKISEFNGQDDKQNHSINF